MQLNKNHGRITCLKLRNCSIGSTKWAPCHKSRSLFLSELWWVHLQSWGRWGTWLSSEKKLPMTPHPHTVRAVKHGWSIYHPSCIRWGKKNCLVLKLFWHQIYDSLWSEEKITTWTYLKLLASPVSFVARNVCSVELTVYGPNIPWLYQFCAGRLQRSFLNEKEKKNNNSPSTQWTALIRVRQLLRQSAMHWKLQSAYSEKWER